MRRWTRQAWRRRLAAVVLVAWAGLVVLGGAGAQAPPSPAPEVTLQLLTAALAAKDKFAAEDRLAELEKLIPADARLAALREQVAALPGLKKNVTVDLGDGVTLELVLIRPGTFTMGSAGGDPDEQPAHPVTLTKPFYLGKYEVTQEQWQAVMGSNPSYNQGAKNPVENVSWDDCQGFITKLNAKAGVAAAGAFRLPSEAEWEYACRAGSTTAYCYGDDEGTLADYAWYEANSGDTAPVGGKKANAWGLYDLHGNVWEWCQDRDGGYPAAAVTDPTGPNSGSIRVNRGGGRLGSAVRCRSAVRRWDKPGDRLSSLGLRVLRLPPGQ